MLELSNFIGGALAASASGRRFDVFEPAVGKVYASAPRSDARDVAAAVAEAQGAFPGWRDLPASERAAWLNRLADLIERDLETFARAESRDTGKPLQLARTLDIPRAIANLRFFAAAAVQFASEAHVMESGALNYTLRQPHGVVAGISPWNLPLYLLTWKIAPALAAGNCVLAKPSEVTPLTAHLLAERCIEARLPPGVLNILHGPGSEVGPGDRGASAGARDLVHGRHRDGYSTSRHPPPGSSRSSHSSSAARTPPWCSRMRTSRPRWMVLCVRRSPTRARSACAARAC